jgi:hypothetical protein
MGFISCNDLDLTPKGQFTEAEFFGNAEGVKIFFSGMYSWLPIEDFLYMSNNENGYRKGNDNNDAWGTWEAGKQSIMNMSGEFVNGYITVNNNGPDYWRYDRIRELNTFIASFPEYRDNFGETEYNALLGEAHFLRAYVYSGMARRYGGVPLIREVQDPMDTPENLNVSRDTEYDTWKFIYEDLKFASENMTDAPDKFRGTRWTALALQSRMMLYAGTIAKYSQYMQFTGEAAYDRGLVGISADRANEFFQYSYEASKELIEEGPYQLYEAQPGDRATNFARLFLDEGSSETIFTKNYIHHDLFPRESFNIGHSYDATMSPNPDMSRFVGAMGFPPLDVMQMYEGFPSLVAPDGKPMRFDNKVDLFAAGMEPRLRGSMFFQGDELRGKTFDVQRGLYDTFTWDASAIEHGVDDELPNGTNRHVSNDLNAQYNGIKILGAHGMRFEAGENNCLTGAFVRKYVDESKPQDQCFEHNSFQAYIVFRLGEIYLNHAEAAYELGRKDEANTSVQAVRRRAGCVNLDISNNVADVNRYEYDQTLLQYEIDVELQFIRDERYRELWGEGHRWWDLRRWRTADRILYQWRPRILSCYYVIDEQKYIYLNEREMRTRTWNFNRSAYYQGIPAGEINRNPNLLPQNPFR